MNWEMQARLQDVWEAESARRQQNRQFCVGVGAGRWGGSLVPLILATWPQMSDGTHLSHGGGSGAAVG